MNRSLMAGSVRRCSVVLDVKIPVEFCKSRIVEGRRNACVLLCRVDSSEESAVTSRTFPVDARFETLILIDVRSFDAVDVVFHRHDRSHPSGSAAGLALI